MAEGSMISILIMIRIIKDLLIIGAMKNSNSPKIIDRITKVIDENMRTNITIQQIIKVKDKIMAATDNITTNILKEIMIQEPKWCSTLQIDRIILRINITSPSDITMIMNINEGLNISKISDRTIDNTTIPIK